jgi:N-acetylglucosaminyldiphosphoundecaprenol N-acetyl-beta-D-mannosaminyltransferase
MGAVVVDRANILGCYIDRLDMDQTLERCEEMIRGSRGVQHVAVNAAKLVALQDDAELRTIVDSCELVSADGQSVVWASRLLGDPLPERVAGIDLMHRLLELAERRAYGVFILGARHDVLETAVGELRRLHPELRIAGHRDGYFADGESAAVAGQVRESGADILLVAMSSPRKEYWLARFGRETGVPFIMGVGGAIDVVAGVARRAPLWMQRAGLEWLFRFVQEPRRMGRRYLVTNTRFAALLAREVYRRRLRGAPG